MAYHHSPQNAQTHIHKNHTTSLQHSTDVMEHVEHNTRLAPHKDFLGSAVRQPQLAPETITAVSLVVHMVLFVPAVWLPEHSKLALLRPRRTSKVRPLLLLAR